MLILQAFLAAISLSLSFPFSVSYPLMQSTGLKELIRMYAENWMCGEKKRGKKE